MLPIGIEISKTTLLDDLGVKRALYEEIGVSEYWVVDVKKCQIFAYGLGDRGSNQIDTSQVLQGFEFSTLAAALQLSRQTDQSQVGAWLME